MNKIAKDIFSHQLYGPPNEKRGSEIIAKETEQRDGFGFKMKSRCGKWKFITSHCNNGGLGCAAVAAKESYEKFFPKK